MAGTIGIPGRPLRPLSLLALLICTACTPAADTDKNIRQSVAAFYRLHEASQPVGALSLSGLIRFRPVLSVALFEKMKDASMTEEIHFQKNPDLLPLFDGDLFSARPQGFSAARVFNCIVDETHDDHAYCNIELNAVEKSGVVKWKERLFLVEDERGWVIDDIDFGPNDPPLHRGRLSALLQAGIERGRTENAISAG